MNDIKELLRPLETVEAPDVRDCAGVSHGHPARHSRKRGLIALIATVTITGLIVGLMLAAFRTHDLARPAVSAPTYVAGVDAVPAEALSMAIAEIDHTWCDDHSRPSRRLAPRPLTIWRGCSPTLRSCWRSKST